MRPISAKSPRRSLLLRLPPQRCRHPNRSSGRRRRSTTFCAARSRISPSTATAGSCSVRQPSWWPRPPLRSCGRWRWPPTAPSMWAAATRAKSSRLTRPERRRPSSIQPSSRCMPSRWRQTATMYAATSPDGRIYKIDRSGKAATVLRSGGQVHLEPCARSTGNLYAGTGEKGLIYRITPDGKGRRLLRDEGHARHFARVRADGPAAGRNRRSRTSVPRRRAGKAFLLLDSTFQEVRADPARSPGKHLSCRLERAHQPVAASRLVTPPAETQSFDAARTGSTVTTEVTAIAVVDTGGASVGTTEAAVREDRRGGPRRHLSNPARRTLGHPLGIGR